MAIFSELDVWVDTQARSASENMAIDQLVMESELKCPLIRFYQWRDPAVSFGYFEKLSDAKRDFPGESLCYVRRWTGGGIVDHRSDQTYSIFLPKGHPVEQMRGNLSYAAIHKSLTVSLNATGMHCKLTEDDSDSEARSCFVKPVAFDIVDALGRKLAGAGQKRSRYGLLHQGSVQGVTKVESWQAAFLEALAEKVVKRDISLGELGDVSELSVERYASAQWTERRP